jgi:TPR repeat protein
MLLLGTLHLGASLSKPMGVRGDLKAAEHWLLRTCERHSFANACSLLALRVYVAQADVLLNDEPERARLLDRAAHYLEMAAARGHRKAGQRARQLRKAAAMKGA